MGGPFRVGCSGQGGFGARRLNSRWNQAGLWVEPGNRDSFRNNGLAISFTGLLVKSLLEIQALHR